MESTLQLVCGAKKLDRDRGIAELQRLVNDADPPGLERLETALTSLLRSQNSQTSWEKRQGVLLGSKQVVAHEWSSETFCTQLRLYAIHSLNDEEARVRLAAGKIYFIILLFLLIRKNNLTNQRLSLSEVKWDNFPYGATTFSLICTKRVI